jgi:hypothetical protein
MLARDSQRRNPGLVTWFPASEGSATIAADLS